MFLYLCIIFSRPFAVFLIRLLIMWIPEFLMVYQIRGGGRAGWVMSRVGNDRGGELDRGGGGKRPGGEVRWESAGGGGKTPGGGGPPDTIRMPMIIATLYI